MEIKVVESDLGKLFYFTYTDFEKKTVHLLSSKLEPPADCSSERINLIRNNKQVRAGSVCWLGGHGSALVFSSFAEDGSDMADIRAEDFSAGDTIEIIPSSPGGLRPMPNFAERYWLAMNGAANREIPYYRQSGARE